MQGTSAKKDREIAAGIASDINKGRKSAEQRIKESENRRKAEAEKPDAQKQKEKNTKRTTRLQHQHHDDTNCGNT